MFGEHNRPLGGDGYLEISSKDNISFEAIRQKQSEALTTRMDEPPNYEFLNQTVSQVYDFYKSHLRPADNSTDRPHFTAFTFAVVDEECLRSEPQRLLICSDAPDFGEADDAIVLKQVRIEATIAFAFSLRLEDLTYTPKEAEIRNNDLDNEDFTALQMEPSPPKLVRADQSPSFDGNADDVGGEYVSATPAQARAKKRAGIKAAESKGWVPGKGWAGGKEGDSVWVVWEDQ